MRNFKALFIAAIAVTGLLAASNLHAASASCGKSRECAAEKSWRGDKGQKIWDELKLTAEQKKKLEENKNKNKEAMKASFEKMKALKESMKGELMKAALDMGRVESIQAEIKTLHGHMEDARLDSILEVRKILTREQFEKFLDLVGRHRK